MISLKDVYHVVEATVPLYVAMSLGYISLKWLKLFTPQQSSGINKFVAKFSVPLLSFQVISTNNPYKMNMKLVCADFLQKLFAFLVLVAILKLGCRGNLSWIITGLSLSTLPNSLILGIPALRAMYGDDAAILLSQIVVLQSLIWYNLLLFLFEINTMTEAYLMPPTEATDLEVPGEAQPKAEQEVIITTSWKSKVVLVLSKVGKKLIINPNTHATISALIWASISFRWGVKLPKIVDESIKILSDGGLGMAMFSLGLFMASQTSIIACGPRKTVLAMAMKFGVGPSLMAVSAVATRLRGTTFRMAIVQAALPQGIVPFVFAREYNMHPDILGTGVIFGMLVALPVALAYYFLLEL